MNRLLLATFLLLPAVLTAQDTSSCATQEGLEYDLDGDMIVGVGDILEVLLWFGTSFDADQDSILDCEDECVGAYDECGVCNGPGPQVLVIDTIIITYDSIYVDAIDDWLVYELEPDTLFSMVCEDLNVFSSCGDEVEMDGYYYSTVLIGDQCWFTENLRTTVYADGSAIPEVTDGYAWGGLSSGAYCAYNNNPSNVDTYGRMYNWFAVNNARSLCPSGWHVPSDGEWTDLTDYIASQGFVGMQGTALKSTTGWLYGGNGTDDFGFSALPGGDRSNGNGSFNSAGTVGNWWSSSWNSLPNGGFAWYRWLFYDNPEIYRHDYDPNYGMSVRCLKDAE